MEQSTNTKVNWTNRRTYVAAGLIAATLSVGILIGTVVSGKVSAMRSFTFAGTSAAPLPCRTRFRLRIVFRVS